MFSSSNVPGVVPAAGLVCLALMLGCGGGSSPTAPSTEVTASIAGQVVSSNSSGALGSHAPVTGITVRVEGTNLSSVTDGQGRFSLTGVPPGDRMLVFDQSGQSARMGIQAVQPAERIDVVVALVGSTVQVRSLERSGSGPVGALVEIEKSTNGEDADKAPGPSIPIGDPVTWEYVVTNTGDVALSRIAVSDDQEGDVPCPLDTLAPGDSMACTGNGFAQAGPYANLGTVRAEDGAGNPVTDDDPSHYTGEGGDLTSIDLEKLTNGEDADAAPGPTLTVGEAVAWDYVLVNDGTVDLVNIIVSDDQGVFVSCPKPTLPAEETMTCTGTGIVQEGQYANLGSVTAEGAGKMATDQDASHYFGEVAGGDEFTVAIQPDTWNTNWSGSSGTVSAKIQDGDLASIDPTSIVLFESDPAVAVVPTNSPGITGNHIRARFSKAEAFDMLLDPVSGETRTVVVRFLANGAEVDLTAEITIVGPGN